MAFYLENPMQEMEQRIVGYLIDIKANIGGVKKDVGEIKQDVTALKEGQKRLEEGQKRIDERVGNLEEDMSEVKGTVNALADALLETSREVKQMKVKR